MPDRKKIAGTGTPGDSIDWLGHMTFALVTSRYFRVLFEDGFGRSVDTDLAMLNLFGPGPSVRDMVRTAGAVDLSSRMRPDGTLAWTPPAERRNYRRVIGEGSVIGQPASYLIGCLWAM